MASTSGAPAPGPDNDNRATDAKDGGASSSGGRPPRMFWLIPALAFLVGLLLGGVLTYATSGGDADVPQAGDTTATAAPSPSPGASEDLTVVVPAACVEAADLSEATFDAVARGFTALRGFDAEALREVVDELQEAQPRVAELATQCREAAEIPTSSATAPTR